ncbi:MAG: hypothetical protein QOC56_2591 [Alphaproteobacteria bacterium]|nr:hypothetical protein [Alphaproteobacteria bacterium]
MTRYICGALLLAFACLMAFDHDRSSAKDSVPKPASMRFEWRTEGPADACGRDCRIWISATGVITDETARVFEAFAKDNDVRGSTIVLDSEGGSVLAAMAFGRAIRRLEMTTTVGKTVALPADAGAPARATLSPKATCESMCAFIMLGGTRRFVPPEARVLVHQIWLGSKSKRALESSYSADELGLVQRDIGRLARYTIEMGGGIELLETALQVPPWEPMHSLTADELRRTRLINVDGLFEASVPEASVPVAGAGAGALTTAAQALRRD